MDKIFNVQVIFDDPFGVPGFFNFVAKADTEDKARDLANTTSVVKKASKVRSIDVFDITDDIDKNGIAPITGGDF